MFDPILVLLIPILPLAGFLVLGLLGRKQLHAQAGWIATVLMLASCVSAMLVASHFFFSLPPGGSYPTWIPYTINWLSFSNGMSIQMGLLIDPISAMMLVVVTLVSLMVHFYSLGYMKGEERYGIYYAFLQLFTFSMLGLVLSSNIFQMYIFWELVGVSSFLLIGFYYQKPAAVRAAKKAFIVTRFADLGFLIGILVLSFYGGTLQFSELIERFSHPTPQLQTALGASFLGISAISWGLVLVFAGGAGKSAMFPLHIWLPDAMEGPTPVSALIHAATMVVAGVYLVARLFPVFTFSGSGALQVVAYAGIVSALFAAVIACTQTDIKRILAYSTMSQIGFMMFALGVSGFGGEEGLGYTASMFHLFTHALFKALLFLCAGTVIHYVHSNEVKDMGGLRQCMPVTHLCFLIACLSIAGIPPFSGFFSKEEILLAAYQHNPFIYWTALFTSGITAFYMFRLYFLVFWNRAAVTTTHGHGEGPLTMLIPLVFLSAGAAGAGFIPFGRFVSSDGAPLHTVMHLAFSILPVTLALVGIAIAAFLYLRHNEWPERMIQSVKSVYTVVYRKFYIDELYLFLTRSILFRMVAQSAAWVDKHIVDGTVNWLGNSTKSISERIKGWQSGKVQEYALWFLWGLIALVVWKLFL